MDLHWAWVWQYGLPLLLVIGSLAGLVSAIRSKPAETAGSRSDWLALPILLILTGDAALGEARPPFERAWKGAVAVLLWVTIAVTVWRRRRRRIESRAAGGAERR
ncbi:hypothetical protein [Actinoplanes digitatis]|uniref:Lysylphosphatidylglycerol synthetase-like protein (DUF2156 family) n=1 Tax=Actinoplanes digitatis TaxID=1868 RepID=A0A7W7I0M2_9ACTN|nr:hypothetical protein [Actinoplanes digitatis]MBB4764176.1 lysylphosphatidylglycerol synthetase-like protein (DUF2156 family) [Actinoplanes digitatis]